MVSLATEKDDSSVLTTGISLPATVVVLFDIWGQRAKTLFDADSELDPMTWIGRCYDLGFIRPVAILDMNGATLADQVFLLDLLAGL